MHSVEPPRDVDPVPPPAAPRVAKERLAWDEEEAEAEDEPEEESEATAKLMEVRVS